jgi:hypothetical protein
VTRAAAIGGPRHREAPAADRRGGRVGASYRVHETTGQRPNQRTGAAGEKLASFPVPDKAVERC